MEIQHNQRRVHLETDKLRNQQVCFDRGCGGGVAATAAPPGRSRGGCRGCRGAAMAAALQPPTAPRLKNFGRFVAFERFEIF